MSPSFQDAGPEQLLDLLRWYGEMGIDTAVDDRPHDRFAESATSAVQPRKAERRAPPDTPTLQPRAALPPRPVAALPALALTPDALVDSAREAAAKAATLEALRDTLERFDGCSLKRTASRLVFADGNPNASIMLVGEAPGADEDRTGLPFVGRGGQLLDRMLGAIGLDRTQVYIANVVPWRPPGNRTPTPQEIAICLPFILRQIALASPEILIFLGGAALQALMATKDGIMRSRGRWLEFPLDARTIRAMPMLHPAYLLRQPAQKALAWRDWRVLQKHLAHLPLSGGAAPGRTSQGDLIPGG